MSVIVSNNNNSPDKKTVKRQFRRSIVAVTGNIVDVGLGMKAAAGIVEHGMISAAGSMVSHHLYFFIFFTFWLVLVYFVDGCWDRNEKCS